VEERTIHQCGRQRLELDSSLEMRPQIPLSQAHNFVWFFLLRSAEPEFLFFSWNLFLFSAVWRSIRRRRQITHKRKTSETAADDRNNPTSSLSLSLSLSLSQACNHKPSKSEYRYSETRDNPMPGNKKRKSKSLLYTQMQNTPTKKCANLTDASKAATQKTSVSCCCA
jgi:hypothetical protein